MNYYNLNNPSSEAVNVVNCGNSAFAFCKPHFLMSTESIRKGVISEILNNNTELFITFNHLYNIVVSLFKFTNLPSLYSENVIKQILVEHGSVAICKRDDEFFIAPYIQEGAKYNQNGDPVEIELANYSVYGFGKIFNFLPKDTTFKNTNKENTFSILRISPISFPLVMVIYYYALKLCDTQEAIDANLFAMQQPVMFSGSKEHKNDLTELFNKWSNKVRAFFSIRQDGVTTNEIKVVDTGAKNNLASLEEHKEFIRKEFFEHFGINAVPYEKKERLLVDEVNSNNMLLEIVQSVYYNTLKDSVERCNKALGTNIKLEFDVHGFLGKMTESKTEESKEGEINESNNFIV